MNNRVLVQTAPALIDNEQGLLTTDESNPISGKRFAAPGIPQTEG